MLHRNYAQLISSTLRFAARVTLITFVILPLAAAQSDNGSRDLPQSSIKFTETFLLPSGVSPFQVLDGTLSSNGINVVTSVWDGVPSLGLYAASGAMSFIGAPTADQIDFCPQSVAEDTAGNYWFVDICAKAVGVLKDGAYTEYFPVTGTDLQGEITLGSDGAMWTPAVYSLSTGGQQVQVIRVASDGTLTPYPVPQLNPLTFDPRAIATGADGNVYMQDAGDIAKITPSGDVTAYSLEDNCYNPYLAGLHNIRLGPDGNIWFIFQCQNNTPNNSIGYITPSGTFQLFPLTDTIASEIASGSDGAVWFIATYPGTQNPNQLGRITTSGTITYTDVNTALPDYTYCTVEPSPALSGLIPGPKGDLVVSAQVDGLCTYLASFTPMGTESSDAVTHTSIPQPASYHSKPNRIAEAGRAESPSPDDRFPCAVVLTCTLVVYPTTQMVLPENGNGFVSVQWSSISNEDYSVSLQYGKDFGLCDVYPNGNPLFAAYDAFNVGGRGNVVFWAWEVFDITHSQYPSLPAGLSVNCSFPFQLVQDDTSTGQSTVLAAVTLKATIIVGF
jgi:hypothetical protein